MLEGSAVRREPFRTFFDSSGLLHWRLIALNGRTLAVSSQTYPDPESAWLGLLAARQLADVLSPSYNHPRSRVGWMWSASDEDGRWVAQGGRTYERRATCVVGFERFQAALRALKS